MSTLTDKLGLIKPELTDAADITATNENWDILDQHSHESFDHDVDMSGNRITGVGEPQHRDEVATRGFVEDFSIEGSTYVAVDENNDGNVILRPYVADEDYLVFESHLKNKSNPHGVTKAQVGLGNVDNTSDAEKPVSTAQAAAIAKAQSTANDAIARNNVRFESWNIALANNASNAQTCAGTVVAVIVAARYKNTGPILTGVWTPQTSGMENAFYGYLGDNVLDKWQTTVTISDKTVTVTRGGDGSITYYCTAIII